MQTRISAVVVTYHPDYSQLKALLAAVVPQVSDLFIIDNGTTSDLGDWLIENSFYDVNYSFLGQNIGIAAAQNLGINKALEINATHVLLLDHDSVPAHDMVEILLCAERELINSGEKVAAVGPKYRLHGTDLDSYFVKFGALRFKKIYCGQNNCKEYIPVDFLISSGSLISCSALNEIGLMDESLFIDHVDTEWFLRSRSRGYVSFGVCKAIMNHNLGDYLFSFWFGKKITLPIHSPLRHYYIFRNSVLLYGRSYICKKWIVNDSIRLLLMFFVFAICISPRKQFIKMSINGIFDGLFRRSGRIGY